MEKTRENTIDTCGLSCPQPALEVLNFIQQNGADTFSVLTDSVTSRENIIRTAQKHHYRLENEEKELMITVLHFSRNA
ncbi:sulfurtransferase TusA family protein [Taurinivorans muris]|jgi:Predicted redox protein, regulator of disulfide bond formation|uniref:Sulfurtransferase TusA family protein n=1 Tax=Taurinivorans muris TaxID=2787751 RepID=A0ABY5Y057_9BACT|nr:sulfurtransferase TusA family protein [Desulfovibrionaceae bacterium LT0009]HBV42408.1 preprotein translocase subunit TatB [Desulfovibrio sp.]